MNDHSKSAPATAVLLALTVGPVIWPPTASAVSKNVWIEKPVNTAACAKRVYRCGSGTECFTAKTSWPEGAAWTWYGASLQGSATNSPSGACRELVAPQGPVNVTAVYNGEVSFAAVVTAVKLDWTTVATTPADRKRNTVGVGEEVELSILPGSVSPVTWWLWPSSGAGRLSSGSGSSVTFTAGATAGNPTIYAIVGDEESLGTECMASLSVIPPGGVVFTGLGNKHEQWSCSAGFHAQVILLPASVSFYRIEVSEMECSGTGSGCYAAWNYAIHPSWSDQGLGWLNPAQNNALPTSVDYVWSGALYPPFSAGLFQWQIPWHYRLIGESGDGYYFATLSHVVTATDTGTCTITKNNLSATFSPSDPSVEW